VTPESIRNVILLIFMIIAAALFLSPFFEPSGTFRMLDGSVGVIDHSEIWRSVNPFSGSVYALGDALCHQMESRSLILNGSQMAFCVRDVFNILGMITGLIATFFIPKDFVRHKKMWLIIALLAIPTFIDWGAQYAFDLNVMFTTAITAIMLGFAIAMTLWKLLLKMFDDILFGKPESA